MLVRARSLIISLLDKVRVQRSRGSHKLHLIWNAITSARLSVVRSGTLGDLCFARITGRRSIDRKIFRGRSSRESRDVNELVPGARVRAFARLRPMRAICALRLRRANPFNR